MSTKVQIVFPYELMARLKRESTRLDISVSEFVRGCVEVSLRSKRRSQGFVDPFTSITGIVKSREKALASRVDEVYDRTFEIQAGVRVSRATATGLDVTARSPDRDKRK